MVEAARGGYSTARPAMGRSPKVKDERRQKVYSDPFL
jgi:hypothetical protein